MPTDPGIASDKWNFNADRAGLWHWSLTDASREIIRASTANYASRDDAVKNARQHGYLEPGSGTTSFPGLRRFKSAPRRLR